MPRSGINASQDRLLWLDSLRGIAILGVVLVHSSHIALSKGLIGEITAAGQYGVQLFFVISAITISMTYHQHTKKYGASAMSSLAWLVRRLFRIWPLYATAALLYVAVGYCLNARFGEAIAHRSAWYDILANLTFVHTWVPSAINSVVPGGWSISVEVMFYGMYPLLMIGRWKPAFPVALVALALIFIAISEFVNYKTNGTLYIENNSYFYLWLPTQLPVILIGCACAFTMFSEQASGGRINIWIAWAIVAAFVWLGLALGTWNDWSPGLAPIAFAPAFCSLALIARSDRSGLIANRWLSQVGVRSYSIYIVHFAVILVGRFLIKLWAVDRSRSGIVMLLLIYVPVVAASYCIASWTRRRIEIPGIEMGRRVSSRLLANAGLAARSA